MLILTRRVGETLMIGDSVTVTVLGVKGNQVRIGITAPKDVAVHREEIYERIQRGEDAESGAKPPAPKEDLPDPEIGRASCRERVCQYVSISVVDVSLKKKTT